MPTTEALKLAHELARHDRSFPNDSDGYRKARVALLAEEIELRRHIERVAVQRRLLPAGGAVPHDYRFQGADGPVCLAELFGDTPTLVTYNWMYGAKRERPCPMCTSMLSALDGEMPDIRQRVAFVVFATSPIDRMTAFATERGWRHLKLYSSAGNDFNRDYAFETPGGEDNAAFNVFTRKDDVIRHSWGDEMGMDTADPGQDPRGAADAMPLWNILDLTPEGRGTDWYPKLEYDLPKSNR